MLSFKYSLELVVFIGGATVMILELTASRILAPYLGASLVIWTSIIGIILGSLSLGYWLGGKLADKNPSMSTLSRIIFFAALSIVFIVLFRTAVLSLILYNGMGIKEGSILANVILFALPSVLLGMVSPYALRLRIQAVATSGKTAGNLYAISTMGSIAGTFSAGFYLIPSLGTAGILVMLAILLFLTAFLIHPRAFTNIVGTAMIAALLFANFAQPAFSENRRLLLDRDTEYHRVWIYEDKDPASGQPVRYLQTDAQGIQGGIFLEHDGLVFEYLKMYHLVKELHPGVKRALAIGGGTYSYPQDFLAAFPDATMDVVEIDPALTDIAREYFRLRDNPRLRITHEDGRTFINRNHDPYDVIYVDAFKTYFPPFHLTTRETVDRLYDLLDQDGILMLNVISAIEGENGKFLRAEYATLKSRFPHVHVFQTALDVTGERVQNLIILAFKSETPPPLTSEHEEFARYLDREWRGTIEADMPILTDDYAPVEYYASRFF